MIHPLADVKSMHIGSNTSIWQYSVILSGAVIGCNCNINCHTFIENDVVIGDNCTIKPGVYLWNGIELEDDVFIGPNATFVNDKFPKSRNRDFETLSVYIERGASIGANATILGGVRIGANSIVGAGTVVTKDVEKNTIVVGNPSRVIRNKNDADSF